MKLKVFPPKFFFWPPPPPPPTNWVFILEKTKQNLHYLAQNTDLITSVVLILDMVKYTLSNVILVNFCCSLDETLFGESMALKVTNKINRGLRLLYRKSKSLSPPLRRLRCNSLIQPPFWLRLFSLVPWLKQKVKAKIANTPR